jgi:hypothetical protein
MDLWLMSDLNGLPGSIFEAISLANVPIQSGGCPPSCIAPPLTHASSLLHPTLLSNTSYWVVASVSADTTASFFENSTGDLGVAQRSAGVWHDFPSEPAVAFRVNGTVVAATVPEPTSIALLAMGLAGLWIRARKRHAR